MTKTKMKLGADKLPANPLELIEIPSTTENVNGADFFDRNIGSMFEQLEQNLIFTEKDFRTYLPLFSKEHRDKLNEQQYAQLCKDYRVRVAPTDIVTIIDGTTGEVKCTVPPLLTDHVRLTDTHDAAALYNKIDTKLRTHDPSNSFDTSLIDGMEAMQTLTTTAALRGEEKLREAHDAYVSFVSYLAGIDIVTDLKFEFVNAYEEFLKEHNKQVEAEETETSEETSVDEYVNGLEFS